MVPTFSEFVAESALVNATAKYSRTSYTIGMTIPPLGKITDVYGNQYEVDGVWYHESIVKTAYFDNLINTSSFNSLRDLLVECFDRGAPSEYHEFIKRLHHTVTDVVKLEAIKKRFKKYDNRVVSQFTWFISNVVSLWSMYAMYESKRHEQKKSPKSESFYAQYPAGKREQNMVDFPEETTSNGVVWKRTKVTDRGAGYQAYWNGHLVDEGGRFFNTVDSLYDFIDSWVVSIDVKRRLG